MRRYRDRPTRVEERVRYVVQVRRSLEAIREARRRTGWRQRRILELLDLPSSIYEDLALQAMPNPP